MEKRGNTLAIVEEDDLKLLKNDPDKFWEGVTSIRFDAFIFLDRLTSIVIPDTVKEISQRAFANCENLKSVKLPEGLEKITMDMFNGCENLEEITIPESVRIIEENAFRDCKNLKKINLPQGLEYIGSSAFRGCKKLQTTTLPDGIKVINDETFAGCEELVSINIPNGVERIGSCAFDRCLKLKELKIPESVTDIGSFAFNSCKGLAKINIPLGVELIRTSTFNKCESLTEIFIPDSVKKIQDSAFSECLSLKSVHLPNGLTDIARRCFEHCHSLENITIPQGVTRIEMGAFNNCWSLQTAILPDGLVRIEEGAFTDCENLQSINIPEKVISIGDEAFSSCKNLKEITLPKSVKSISSNAFKYCDLSSLTLKNPKLASKCCDKFEFLYMAKDEIVLSKDKNEVFAQTHIEQNTDWDSLYNAVNNNYRNNLITLREWKKQNKIKFIPPVYTLKTFPFDQIEKYYINNNNKRWAKLTEALGFQTLRGDEKEISLTDLMKIYYAIGGFSDNQGESEKAYNYIIDCFSKKKSYTPSGVGRKIHEKFSKLNIEGPYNKDFAQFFMKYYNDNPNFMVFELNDSYGFKTEKRDYLCQAHNAFNAIQKAYPNRVVNGNTERDLLTPRFVAEHSSLVSYGHVNDGNEELAKIIGRYGYSQDQFDHIQDIYEQAKKLDEQYVIMADRSNETEPVTFRVIEKDDPIGFVLGDITDCCQHIGGAGASCVDDGFLNPNAGFIVFEERLKDEKGNYTGETRILGQAYVWYDPQTKTVCYDNIEIPRKVLDEIRGGEKNNKNLSSSALMDAVERSAEAIIKTMNKNGIKVERVTTGEGYNDLNKELLQRYEKETSPIAKHRSYSGYSDARHAQYIIKTRSFVVSANIENAKEIASRNLQLVEKDNLVSVDNGEYNENNDFDNSDYNEK